MTIYDELVIPQQISCGSVKTADTSWYIVPMPVDVCQDEPNQLTISVDALEPIGETSLGVTVTGTGDVDLVAGQLIYFADVPGTNTWISAEIDVNQTVNSTTTAITVVTTVTAISAGAEAYCYTGPVSEVCSITALNVETASTTVDETVLKTSDNGSEVKTKQNKTASFEFNVDPTDTGYWEGLYPLSESLNQGWVYIDRGLGANSHLGTVTVGNVSETAALADILRGSGSLNFRGEYASLPPYPFLTTGGQYELNKIRTSLKLAPFT